MGTVFRFDHIGSQVLLVAVLLIVGSANTLGTQSASGSLWSPQMTGVAGQSWTSPTKRQQRRQALRDPRCTPGFSCSMALKVSNRVSRREAVYFAFLLGVGSIN